MKLRNIKNFAIKKKDAAAAPDDVVIESTTAAQIAEMKKRLANRTKDLEEAQSRLKDLKSKDGEEAEDARPARVGPHPPLQELTLDDLKLDEENEDEDLQFDTPTDGASPVQVVDLTAAEPAPDPDIETLNIEDVAAPGPIDNASVDLTSGGDSDDLKHLFSQDEEEEHPLANLINFLPDVSVQELVDDIEEIKSIIKEWQQSR
jgi:hypothetical protein